MVALFTVCTFKLNINKLMQAKQNRKQNFENVRAFQALHRHTRPPDNKELLPSSSHLRENGSSNNGSDRWRPKEKWKKSQKNLKENKHLLEQKTEHAGKAWPAVPLFQQSPLKFHQDVLSLLLVELLLHPRPWFDPLSHYNRPAIQLDPAAPGALL